MKKYFYSVYTILLMLILVVPFSIKADADVDSNGGANQGSTTQEINKGIRISNYNDFGLRITVVDENGNIIAGTKTVDYWASGFGSSTIKQMPGATYKTAIVNQGGLSYTPLKNFNTYKEYGFNSEGELYDASHIKGVGTGSWNNKHTTLEQIVDKNVNGKTCKNPEFLQDTGFNICKYIENNECEELKKIYILIEPLVRMHDDNWVYYVFSGTEAANFFPASYAAGEISLNTYKNNFGGTVYRNLINMYLTNKNNDSLSYKLNSNGSIYAYFKSKPTSSNAGNESSERMNLFAGKNHDSKGNPWGSSMQLVWLGRAAKNCDEPKCCVPCNPDDQACIDAAGDNYDPKDPSCCYETNEIKEGDKCIPADDYWKSHDKPAYCLPKGDCDCAPGTYVNYLGTKMKCEDYIKNYCQKICPPPSLKGPTAEVEVCDDNTSESKKATFIDGHFSDNYMDFKPLFEATDSIYNDGKVINQYCTKYCQEKVEITLPNNYPTTYAGRFFIWSITDDLEDNDDNVFVRETIYRNCATNIDLDKWFSTYLDHIRELQGSLAAIGGHAYMIPEYGTKMQAKYDECMGGGGAANEAANEAIKNMNATTESAISGFEDAYSQSNLQGTSNLSELGRESFANSSGQPPNGILVISEINLAQYNAEYGTSFTMADVMYGNFFEECGKAEAESLINRANNGDEKAIETIKEKNEKRLKPKCGDIISNACGNILTVCRGLGGGANGEDALSTKCDVRHNISGIQCVNIEPDNSSLYQIIKGLMACEPELADDYTGEYLATNGFGFDSAINQLDIEMGYETFLEMNTYQNPDFDIVLKLEDIDVKHGCNGIKCDSDECSSNIFTSKYCALPINFVPEALTNNSHVATYDTLSGAIAFQDANSEDYYFCNQKEKISSIRETYNWPEFKKYWNTWIFTKEEVQFDYSLKDNINACICKDGTVIDASADGSCDCPEPETVYEVVSDINTGNYCYFEWKSYTVLPEGSFSVEFMNPTGFYPLYLRYSNIGTEGHFSEFLMDGQLVVDYCSPDDGSCYYSDENDICRYSIYNDILNDGGYIEDANCPEGECPPNSPVCPNGDCNICGGGECSGGNGKGDTGEIAGMELIYRVIDLDTPFPGSDATGENSSRSPGANWLGTTDGVNPVSDYIENNRGVEGSKLYNSDLDPLYEFTINPAIIKKIRALNAANRDYASLSTMVFDDATIVGGVSYVLRGDLKNIVEGNGGYFSINLDGDSRFTDINNNSAIDSSGNLVCRGVSR